MVAAGVHKPQLFRAAWVAVGVLAGVVAVNSCTLDYSATGLSTYENDDQLCDDGLDNDQDGLIDCQDPDCVFMSVHCGEHVPLVPFWEKENRADLCHDHIDNDDDGQFDCGDPKCRDIPEACCGYEANDQRCSDGKDNDSNGFTDCRDFSCKGGFVVVCRSELLCNVGAFGPFEDKACCSDGKDSDGDGFTDCADRDCQDLDECKKVDNPGPEDNFERCTDKVSNDGDTYVDCSDTDCFKVTKPDGSLLCETTLATCSDGKDNDGNGYGDCADFSCSSSKDSEIKKHCAEAAENTLAKCKDGKDNDGNGYADCNDNNCSAAEDKDGNPIKEIVDHCKSVLESTFEKCSDGIDNDGNGYADCEDRSCQPVTRSCSTENCVYNSTTNLSAAQACQESLAYSQSERDARCSDGLDNDGDGFVDCDDYDCSLSPSVTVCKDKPKVCGSLYVK